MIKRENTKVLPKTWLGKFIQGIINFFAYSKMEVIEDSQKELINVSSREEIIEDCKRKLDDIQEKIERTKDEDLKFYKSKASSKLEEIKVIVIKVDGKELFNRVEEIQNMLCPDHHCPNQ